MTPQWNRREFGLGLGCIGMAFACGHTSFAGSEKAKFGYGFSLYGMKSLPLTKAIATCEEIGYDSVELPAMVDWPGAAETLSTEDRKRLRSQLDAIPMKLSAIMENLPLLAERSIHEKNLDRLKKAAELAQDLDPKTPPPIETVMGGKPGEWEKVKQQMVERLGAWAEALAGSPSKLALKAHVSGAAHRPEHIQWLLQQVNHPSLKAAFDFSHFQLRGLDLTECWNALEKDVVFIHIKDSIGDLDKFRFVLPGEGSINYESYLKLLDEKNCRVDITVEVSGQVHSQPGYDPIMAAKKSYTAIAPIMKQLGIERPRTNPGRQ